MTWAGACGTPNGIRTRAATLRGWCPRPLDDGGWWTRQTTPQHRWPKPFAGPGRRDPMSTSYRIAGQTGHLPCVDRVDSSGSVMDTVAPAAARTHGPGALDTVDYV